MECLTLKNIPGSRNIQEKKRMLPPSDEGGPGFGNGGGPPATGKPALGEDEPMGGELLTTEGGVSLA